MFPNGSLGASLALESTGNNAAPCAASKAVLACFFAWVAIALIGLLLAAREGQAEAPQTAAASASTRQSDEKNWSLSFATTLNSKYVWRGINLVDDPVLQPEAALAYKGLTLSVWANMELTEVNGRANRFTEFDYTADYSYEWKDVVLSIGAIHYRFPNTKSNQTTEVYVAAGLNTILSPCVTVFRDVAEAKGTYAALAVGHTFEDIWRLSRKAVGSIDLSARIGYGSSNYNQFYYGTDNSAFSDVELSAGLPLKINERWTLTPSVTFTSLLSDGHIRQAMRNVDNWVVGVSLGVSF